MSESILHARIVIAVIMSSAGDIDADGELIRIAFSDAFLNSARKQVNLDSEKKSKWILLSQGVLTSNIELRFEVPFAGLCGSPSENRMSKASIVLRKEFPTC